MNDIAEMASQYAFEDAPAPTGIVMEEAEFGTIPAEAYTSPDYALAEADKLWGKVWQTACRVEEIPNVGDYVTYDIMDESIIVVRTAAGSGPDAIKAYFNVCQHRGRRLTDGSGNARQFFCRFHGWRWKIDGECVFVNDRKGFGDKLTPDNTRLPEIKVDSWGGWLWINMDPDCEPLNDFLAPAMRLLTPFELDKMRYRWRQWLVFPCNWKTALEAFSESHHAAITHPQLNRWGVTTFYACRTEGKHAWHGPASSTNPGRPGAKNGENFEEETSDGRDPRVATAEMMNAIMDGVNSCVTDTIVKAADRLVDELPPGSTATQVAAHLAARAEADDAARGVVWPKIDPELMVEGGHDWHIFPNSVVLHGLTYALCYRARPNGANPDSCIFEVYVIERYPEGGEPETEWVHVPDPKDRRWPEVLQQDFENMPEVQRGMKSRGFRGARPNPRQEVAVYHFHQTLAGYMGTGAPEPL